MPKKLVTIDYTSRDFDSIREDLLQYAKKYYPNSFQDFNEASFGALMVDTVAYIGDILSFYVDYQANESFLDTAIEYNNVVKLARQMGYKMQPNPSSYGLLTFYIKVPAAATGLGPDETYVPTLQVGSQFSSIGGTIFTLIESINFGGAATEKRVADVNSSTGIPTSYVIRAQGRVVSGRINHKTIEVGAFQRFLRVPIGSANVTEIVSVLDQEGHEYFEVDNLSQNVIYKAVRNNNVDRQYAPSILKARPVPRRFVLEREGDSVYLQFGYGSTADVLAERVVDPSNVILDIHGRDYTTDKEFDPTNLIHTDKFGIAPVNTALTVAYRINTRQDVNAAANTIIKLVRPIFKFDNEGALSRTKRTDVITSLESNNDLQIVGDVSTPSSTEIKQRVYSYFATQKRAVTIQDYKALSYAMPSKFGSIKRCNMTRDFDSFKRNLNLYVISEDNAGKLVDANNTIKANLKTWLSQYKVINDTIDILDAKIVNFGVEYIAISDYEVNKFNLLNIANARIGALYKTHLDIGEPIYVSDIYKELNKIDGVVDVLDVRIIRRTGPAYSLVFYDLENRASSDGRYVAADNDVIFELKFPKLDIKGSIR